MRIRVLAPAIALTCVLSGCVNNSARDARLPPAPSGLTGPVDGSLRQMFPARVRSAGVLQLAADPTYPPSTFKDGNGTIVGVLPDLAAAITSRAGLRIKWVEVPFDGMLAGLAAHRFDASWSGWTITAEREHQLNLVSYIRSGTSVLVKKGNPAGIRTWRDLCGRPVAAQTGTTQAQEVADELDQRCAKAKRAAVALMRLPKQTDVNQAVATGRADALLADSSMTGYQARIHPDVFVALPSIVLRASDAAVGVPKDDTQLAKALTAGFNRIIADGTYGRVLARWNNTGSAVATAHLNPVRP
ncbi:MAG TPA: ABC transporter substrate-binding protein [Streptosporangiaceae bacterium]|jgi:polar amino acid transport system substrate-binding protein